MKAGVAICDISPQKGVDLGGYPYFYRQNEGIHDPLFGGVLYLHDSDDQDVLLLISDLFYLNKNLSDKLRQHVQEVTGISFSNIIITCSHTHSAPWMVAMFENIDENNQYAPIIDEDYNEFVIKTYAETAKHAIDSCFDSEFSFVKTTCGKADGVGGNRRDPINGPCDEDLPILLVRDQEQVIRAIFIKYALHPTILHGENKLVSADFPGAIREKLKSVYPEAVFLFAQGTSGDQSPRYFTKNKSFDEVKLFGETIAKKILLAIPKAKYNTHLSLNLLSDDVNLIMKKYQEPAFYSEQLKQLREKEQILIDKKATPVELQNANLAVLGAECNFSNAKKFYEGELTKKFNSHAPFMINILLLNEIAYVFLPGEIFSEFGLQIKERSPIKETHIITLSNGDLPGYCVTETELKKGGYEPYNSLLDPISGQKIVEKTLYMLEKINQSK